MSRYTVKPPAEAQHRVSFAVMALVMAVALLLTGFLSSKPMRVTVDGRSCSVPPGSRLSDLVTAGIAQSAAGNLIGVDGSVAKRGGGAPASFTLNGRPAPSQTRLYGSDVVESATGANLQEAVITTDVAIPFQVREEGRGPLSELRALGAPGVRRVTLGEVSGIEITSTVVMEPSDMVIGFARPVNGKFVVLTFDDGPYPTYTAGVLRVLKDYDVHATFFMLGLQVRRNPGLARQVVAEGHTVGNHTYSHKKLAKLPPAKIRWEIKKGREAIYKATGVNTRWTRPPYGSMGGKVWRQLSAQRLRVALWDVDSRDWKKPGARKIAASVLKHTKPGSVIIMHDGGGNRRQTVRALEIIIPQLKRRGYTFVTLDQLDEMRREDRAAAAAKRRAPSKASGAQPGGSSKRES